MARSSLDDCQAAKPKYPVSTQIPAAAIRDAAMQSIREALSPHVKGNAVPLGASIWIVTARAS